MRSTPPSTGSGKLWGKDPFWGLGGTGLAEFRAYKRNITGHPYRMMEQKTEIMQKKGGKIPMVDTETLGKTDQKTKENENMNTRYTITAEQVRDTGGLNETIIISSTIPCYEPDNDGEMTVQNIIDGLEWGGEPITDGVAYRFKIAEGATCEQCLEHAAEPDSYSCRHCNFEGRKASEAYQAEHGDRIGDYEINGPDRFA